MNDNYLLSRQPIMDRNEKSSAYKLLLRSEQARGGDASPSPVEAIIDSLSGRGAGELFGDRRGVVTVDAELLMNDLLLTLPCGKIILELRHELALTGERIERCRRLQEAGFGLALVNHRFLPELKEFYQTLDLIGIDLRRTPGEQLRTVVGSYHQFPGKLFAHEVESRAEFAQCQSLGFDFFQGSFFVKPTTTVKKKLNESTVSLLRIVQLIMNDADNDLIVRVFQESPALTYKLLLQANSAAVGARREVDSVRHAVSLLGRDQIRRWAQMELLAAGGAQEQETPLVEMAAVRAGFMEHLTKCHPMLRGFRDAADRAFLAGTLSMLEAIYNIPVESIVEEVALSDDVRIALLHRRGLFGEMLAFAESLERCDFDTARALLVKLKIPHQQMLDAQRNSFHWKSGTTA